MLVVKRAYSLLLHTLLLAIYAIFFSVQVFFNFEAFSHTQAISDYSIFSHAAHHVHYSDPGAKASLKRSPGQPASKTTLRLNKRFQQEDMPPCETVAVPAPIEYTIPESMGHYENVFLLSVYTDDSPLRGPPAAS